MTSKTNSTPLELSNVPGSYEERYAEAYQLYRREEFEQAIAICERIVDRVGRLPERRRPQDSPLDRIMLASWILLAKIRARQGNWVAVDELCSHAQQVHPSLADRWRMEPLMLRMAHGQPAEGLQGMQALVESEPDKLFFWSALAQAALESGDLPLTETSLDHALRLARADDNAQALATLHGGRFQVLRQRGQWFAAAQAFDEARGLDPEMEDLRETVVRMFLSVQLWDEALRYVEGPSIGPATAAFYRAWIANQRGDTVRARYLWRKLVETEPDDEGTDTALIRAVSHCWLGQPDAALAILLAKLAQGALLEASEATALALAWAMHGDVDAARDNLKLASQRHASEPPLNRLLPALNWIEFEQLVADEAIKAELRPFFEPAPAYESPPSRP